MPEGVKGSNEEVNRGKFKFHTLLKSRYIAVYTVVLGLFDDQGFGSVCISDREGGGAC